MNRYVALLVLLALAGWVATAAVEYVLQPKGGLLDWLFFAVPVNALIQRTVTSVLITLAGLVMALSSRGQLLAARKVAGAEDSYASMLRGLPVGVYRIASDGKILEANDQFAKILGFRDSVELKGSSTNFNEFFTSRTDREKQLDKLREGPAFAEFELRRKDGSTLWIRDYPHAVSNVDGSVANIDGVCVEMHGIDAIMRDITEHRKLQGMKEHFIVSVTHELRTPLVSIKGYIDHIIQKETNLPKELRAQIEIVKRNADRLLQLTDDLLKLQDTETGHVELKIQPLMLREALAQGVEEVQPLLIEKKQTLKLEIPDNLPMVSADPLRFAEVLMNLLQNAIKFTPVEGTITIRAQDGNGMVAISVTDTGIGIDANDLDRVFEPFAVIAKPGYFKGTGLGLSLTRKLVDAQHGKVWAESVGKGRGSTFTFTLPKLEEKWLVTHG